MMERSSARCTNRNHTITHATQSGDTIEETFKSSVTPEQWSGHSPFPAEWATTSHTLPGSSICGMTIRSKRSSRIPLCHTLRKARRSSSLHYSFKAALLLLFFTLMSGVESRRNKCVFPQSWKGEWFISGVIKPIVVSGTSLSFKGECVQNLRDRYLIKNPVYHCYRCLVIHQKHKNVLQYKETYCDKRNSLKDVCALLAGDAQLHSLFRVGAEPVPCPFQHTYVFAYNRGHGECSYPPSTVFSCIEDWRLLFRYQACPDLKGTESKSEELVCLAVWKEGSNRYLVGKSDHPLATSDEDRYRCFVYETWEKVDSSGFKVAQSGDATCNGLFSVNDGSRTLFLTKVDFTETQCKFPSWVGGSHWHSLDGGTSLHLTRHNSTLKLNGHSVVGGPATHACYSLENSTLTTAKYITRVTHGCDSGYQCIQLVSRDSHVLELKMGKLSPLSDPEAACTKHYFDASSRKFATFVSLLAESRSCPGSGRYEVLGGTVNAVGNVFPTHGREGTSMTLGSCEEEAFKALSVGCSSRDTLEIHTTCSDSEYSCHGYWEEAGWQYLVVTPVSRSSKGVRRLCLVIDRGEEVLSLASSAHSCDRELSPGHRGRIALNSTSRGVCEALASTSGCSSTLHGTIFNTVVLYLYLALYLLWRLR